MHFIAVFPKLYFIIESSLDEHAFKIHVQENSFDISCLWAHWSHVALITFTPFIINILHMHRKSDMIQHVASWVQMHSRVCIVHKIRIQNNLSPYPRTHPNCYGVHYSWDLVSYDQFVQQGHLYRYYYYKDR